MIKKNIAVLFGGRSTEHTVSLHSAASILRTLDAAKYHIFPVGITKQGRWLLLEDTNWDLLETGKWEAYACPAYLSPDCVNGGLIIERPEGQERVAIDCAFPIIHGKYGEDGALQGFLEMAGIPYVGCDVASSANSMDKSLTKVLAEKAGIKQASYVVIRRHAFEKNPSEQVAIIKEILHTFLVFVKPCVSGSSVGAHMVKNETQIIEALTDAFLYDDKVLVEEFIAGKEIEVAILGDDTLIASVAGEIVPGDEYYTYEAKYTQGVSDLYIPARIDEKTMTLVQEIGKQVFKAVDGYGLARVDFFYTADKELIFNEINTIPGFTATSMYPKLMDYSGIPYRELLDRLIELAQKRGE